jgi:hypothetical protein
MTFALHSALKVSLIWAIPLAIAWGFAIMSLDRWLMISLARPPTGKLRGYRLLVPLALSRLGLAILFGTIISTPLTLQVFHPEIAQRISIDQTTAASNFQASLKSNALYIKVEKDQQAVAADQAVIDSDGGTGVSPADDKVLTSLNTQLNQDLQHEQNNYYQWHCEIYGTPGHCTVGPGPAAAANWNSYQYYQGQVVNDRTQIHAEQQRLNAQNKTDAAAAMTAAQQNRATDKATLAADMTVLNILKNSFNSNNAANSGILASLQALEELRASHPTVFWAELLLFLFFTAIECLPVLVKVLLVLGPENYYEQLLAHAEQAGFLVEKQAITLASVGRLEEIERSHSEQQPELLTDSGHAPEGTHQGGTGPNGLAPPPADSWRDYISPPPPQ